MAERDIFFIAVMGLAGIIVYALSRSGSITIPDISDFSFVPDGSNPIYDPLPSDTGHTMPINPRMALSDNGAALIKQFEGFSATPYPDAGKISIGYGHQIKPGESFSSVTREQADALFYSDISWAENAVNDWVSVPLSQGQFDALVSLIYNIGASAFHLSTLLSKLNSGDYEGAANEFQRWNKSAGSFNPVLAARREAELNIWFA